LFLPNHHIWTKQAYEQHPCSSLVTTQFETFKNLKVGYFVKHRVGIISSTDSHCCSTVALRPSPASPMRVHKSVPCRVASNLSSHPLLSAPSPNEEKRRKSSPGHLLCLHCSPSTLSSPSDAIMPSASPVHPQTTPTLPRPSLPLELAEDPVTAMPRPRPGHHRARPPGLFKHGQRAP
jgi:hypothetical protein